MTMEEIQSGSPPEGRELSQAIVELQNLRFSVVNGAAADTNITLTGFTWGTDTVVAVLYYPVSGGNGRGLPDRDDRDDRGQASGHLVRQANPVM
jgi:hypothetical protein